jgi:hypothetical protein
MNTQPKSLHIIEKVSILHDLCLLCDIILKYPPPLTHARTHDHRVSSYFPTAHPPPLSIHHTLPPVLSCAPTISNKQETRHTSKLAATTRQNGGRGWGLRSLSSHLSFPYSPLSPPFAPWRSPPQLHALGPVSHAYRRRLVTSLEGADGHLQW